jgi:REP element-mobilizing transposase RayT
MIAKAVNLEKVIGDFKKYTSKELMKNLLATDPNLAKLFTPKNGKLKIWQETNYPQLIETEKFFLIKFNYIRNNPVKKEYVLKPEYWKWSSVNPESEIKTDAFF